MKNSTSEKTTKINVINKNGLPARYTELCRAERSVQSGKARWINEKTIQILFHKDDEARFREEACRRDQYICYLCGKHMHEGHPELTVDHIRPKRLGGSIFPENLGTCCRPCNEQKGWRTYELYFQHLFLGLAYMILWFSKSIRRLSSGSNKEKG